MKKICSVICCLLAWALLTGCSVISNPDTGKTAPMISAAKKAAPTLSDPAKQWRKLDLSKYANANTILLDDIEKVVYNADGTYRRSDKFRTLIRTEKGRDDHRTLSWHFNSFYEKKPQVVIEIIKPDGTVVKPVLQEKVSVESSQMQSNIYDPANKVLTVGIPGLEVGDILYCKNIEETIRPRMQNVWCTIALLQTTDPILSYSYTISAPENTPLVKLVVKDEVKGTLSRSEKRVDGRIIYTFEAKNVPQILPEPDMPPWYLHSMRILASTAPDWESVSRWYYNLCMPHIKAVSPELTAKAKTLAAGKNEKAAIRAMFDFVSKEIRYTGVTNENTAPGYEPHDVKDTFAQKHGVCRDKAALLAAMLLEAGFDAFPVLFMAGDPKDPEVPNNYFNHAITGVKTASGELILMDPTDENSVDMLPGYAMDKSFLCATKKGDTLRRTAVVPAEKNLVKIKSQGVIDKDFTLHLSSKLTFDGVNDNIYRSAFARWSKNYQEQFTASAIKRALPGAELKNFKVLPENIRDLSQPFQMFIECTVKDIANVKWSSGLIAMPFIGREFGLFNFMVGDKLLKGRKYPMRFDSTAGVVEDCVITLQGDLKVVALPAYKKLSDPVLESDFKVQFNAGQLVGSRNTKLKTVEVSAAQYAGFIKAVQNISFADKRKVVAQRKIELGNIAKDGAKALVLDKLCRVTFSNRSDYTAEYTVKKQILNYAGVKEHSELSLSFVENILTAEFISARVFTADGKLKNNVDIKTAKIMDEAVSAGAPRYPAAKRLVLPLPGVEPGCMIEYVYRMSFKGMHNACNIVSLAEFMPVMSGTAVFSYPASLQKYFKLLLPAAGFDIERKSVGKNNIVAVKAENIPMYKEEPAVPPVKLFAPIAGISSFDTAKYAETVLESFRKAADKAPEATRLATDFVQKYPDLRQRVRAIRDFVAQKIRPAGLETDVLGCKYITPADVTLRDGYGNSIDRAVLLYSLLKNAGIENIAVVLASDMPDLEVFRNKYLELPQNSFKAALLRVSLAGGDFYLNDCNEYAELGSCSYENHLGLDLSNGELITINSSVGYAAGTRQYWQINCLAGNAAEITVNEYFYGTTLADVRKFFDRITPEKERQYWEQQLAGFLAGAGLVSVKKELDKYPGMISYKVKHPDFWQNSGGYVSFRLPTVLSNLFRTAGKRTLPYLRSATDSRFLVCEVNLLKDWKDCKLIAPAVERSLPGGESSVSRKCEITADNTLIFSEKANIAPFYLDSSGYVLLENLQKELSDPAKLTILFKTSGK